MEGVAYGNLHERGIEIDNRVVTTVMLVSGGYPGDYKKGFPVNGLDLINDSIVFHAGTKLAENGVITAGGRVLAVSSYGNSMKEALDKSYRNASLLKFDGIYYRKDIGFDL
jgi:phosphoribosylamine--glycine ligase